eukprot:144505-Amphidinium_carterae.2
MESECGRSLQSDVPVPLSHPCRWFASDRIPYQPKLDWELLVHNLVGMVWNAICQPPRRSAHMS